MTTGKNGKIPVKPWDVVIIFLAICLTGFSVFSTYIKTQNNSQVLIEGKNQRWIFPLDAEETINVQGPLGITVVRIHENQTWVESSPCDNKICIGAGHLRNNGEFSACLPNNVLIVIEGNDISGEIDAYSR
jgi:hypothetical protein